MFPTIETKKRCPDLHPDNVMGYSVRTYNILNLGANYNVLTLPYIGGIVKKMSRGLVGGGLSKLKKFMMITAVF